MKHRLAVHADPEKNQGSRATTRESPFLCVGSACHQLEVFEVLPILEELIRDFGLVLTVALKGTFCLDHCAVGIALQYRDRISTLVNHRNLRTRSWVKILPCLRARQGRLR